ncbi:MAG: nickel-dependent lactate racemase [Clostridia bacterium]|nr:nickel-dependent lactate racemase [Clostridia bacterium]
METNPIGVLYGKGKLTFDIPSRNLQQVIEPKRLPGTDGRKTIVDALEHPIGSPSLRELTKDIHRLLIITSDNTRPMPSRESIPAILSQLYREEGDYSITILIATGLHREMTPAEIRERFPEEVTGRHRIVNHVATDDRSLVCLGKMSTGNELWVNRLAVENELVIAEGFIEPHFFAGFSGGRKSILPGICGAKTILANHCPKNIASPYATAANLEGNPVHMECAQAAKLAGLGFIMNVVLNRDKEIIAAFAGEPARAHLAGCEYVKRNMEVAVRPADIVIASNNGHPLDRNLYQSVKGMDTASRAVKKGGVIILASECPDKNGNNEFERLIASCHTPEELFQEMSSGEPEPDKWQAQIFARILMDHKIILVSDKVSRTDAERLFMTHCRTPDEALRIALGLEGPDAKINVIPEGPVVIPVMSGTGSL